MTLLNWFSGLSGRLGLSQRPQRSIASAASSAIRPLRHNQPIASPNPAAAFSGDKPMAEPSSRSEARKAKRHARREQLYVAVKESMTRAGVLSASYKFKVLSLDQRGDQFLVMMDVNASLGGQIDKLAESEARIMQLAKARFDMTVTSVYWRLDVQSQAVGLLTPLADQSPADVMASAAALAEKTPNVYRYEPIQAEEAMAFRQAVSAGAAIGLLTADAGKSRSGLRSFTLITGFEDTEMPEAVSAPALSATQYGELQ